MSETLQIDEGRNGKISELVRPTELVIDSKYCELVREFVDAAKGEILICAYAWRWYENDPAAEIQKLNSSLMAARLRGVNIRVLAESQIIRDRLRALGVQVKGVERNRMMHTKALCIDSRTLIIGSHNLTKRATSQNYEMSIMTQEFQVVDAFMTYFEAVWSTRG